MIMNIVMKIGIGVKSLDEKPVEVGADWSGLAATSDSHGSV
jgi:hypothetical protein